MAGSIQTTIFYSKTRFSHCILVPSCTVLWVFFALIMKPSSNTVLLGNDIVICIELNWTEYCFLSSKSNFHNISSISSPFISIGNKFLRQTRIMSDGQMWGFIFSMEFGRLLIFRCRALHSTAYPRNITLQEQIHSIRRKLEKT